MKSSYDYFCSRCRNIRRRRVDIRNKTDPQHPVYNGIDQSLDDKDSRTDFRQHCSYMASIHHQLGHIQAEYYSQKDKYEKQNSSEFLIFEGLKSLVSMHLINISATSLNFKQDQRYSIKHHNLIFIKQGFKTNFYHHQESKYVRSRAADQIIFLTS